MINSHRQSVRAHHETRSHRISLLLNSSPLLNSNRLHSRINLRLNPLLSTNSRHLNRIRSHREPDLLAQHPDLVLLPLPLQLPQPLQPP